jgi:uncharacterized membrane protein
MAAGPKTAIAAKDEAGAEPFFSVAVSHDGVEQAFRPADRLQRQSALAAEVLLCRIEHREFHEWSRTKSDSRFFALIPG